MTGFLFFFGIGAFCLGLIVGSFLNVCVYRMPREESIIYPPSHCPRCYRLILSRDNIPVLSWLLLRGRCRGCGEKISPVYPAVELLTGMLFAFYYWRFAETYVDPSGTLWSRPYFFRMGALYLAQMAFICALLVATFVDFKHFIIPDEISIGGTLFAVAVSLAFPGIQGPFLLPSHMHLSGVLSSLLGAAVGAGSIYAIGAVGKLLLRKEAMGFGDVKLMAMIGAFLGWKVAIFVLFASAVLGAVYGAVHMAVTGSSRIPYGPFLSIAAVISLIFRSQVDIFLNSLIEAYRYLLT